MEFAQHGSLRSYLHKCRGQENGNNRDQTLSIQEPDHLYQVSRKDILCFSWQIAKGMEYLSNKKVIFVNFCATEGF